MRIQLDDERGDYLCVVEAPRITPWPDVVTFGGATYRYHEARPTRMIYRRCFAMALDGFVLPAETRVERA